MNGNDRAITLLVMVGHALVHTYEMTIPLFVVIWLQQFEVIALGPLDVAVTTTTIGLVVTASYGLFGIGALPGGVLVDYVGSRRLIAGCLAGMGGSFLLLGVAPNMAVVALALLCWGIAASVYHPAGLALISRGVTERGTGLAYHGIAGNVGIGVGPLVVATGLLLFDWRTVALGLGLPAVCATIYAARARFEETAAIEPETAENSTRNESPIGSLAEFFQRSRGVFAAGFLVVFVIVVCSGLYYRGVLTFLPEVLRGLEGFDPIALEELLPRGMVAPGGPGDTGRLIHPQDYFYSGLLTVGVLGQYAGGKLSDAIPVGYGLAGAFGALALLAVAFLPVSRLGSVPLVGLGILLGVLLFVVQPMYQAAVAEYSSPETRGLSYGYTYVGVFGIGALGGGLAGAILEFGTATTLFLTLGAVATIGCACSLLLARVW